MEIAFKIILLFDTSKCSTCDAGTNRPNAMLVQIQES